MKENQNRTVENVLNDGPSLEWYYGFGKTDKGITGINYSEIFRRAYNGELKHHLGQWAHIGVVPRVFGIPEGEVDKFEPLVMQMHEHALKVYEISGFWPEEIAAKN